MPGSLSPNTGLPPCRGLCAGAASLPWASTLLPPASSGVALGPRSLQWDKSSAQSLSRVRLSATPWIACSTPGLPVRHHLPEFTQTHVHHVSDAIQPPHPLSPLLLLPSISPSIRVFSSESALHMRWPKYWSFSFSIIPSKEHPGLISFRMDWLTKL